MRYSRIGTLLMVTLILGLSTYAQDSLYILMQNKAVEVYELAGIDSIIFSDNTSDSIHIFGQGTYRAGYGVDEVDDLFFKDIRNTDYPGYAPVFQKLKKGVNQDAAMKYSGTFDKLVHERAHMQAISEAGFESVRLFLPYSAGSGGHKHFEQRIQDALDYELAVVICMWGKGWGDDSWANKPEQGAIEIADRWRKIADDWKNKFSNEVVFEILNEPEGIGFKSESTFPDVMNLYNSAVAAIREVDADRPILVGCPGYNDAEYLDPWVTEEYLTYSFNGGLRFYDDPNIGVAIHYYSPSGHDAAAGYPNFAMWTASLGNRWKGSIDRHFNDVETWRNAQDCANVPVVVTEWGCWLFESRNQGQDLPTWLDYNLSLMEEHNIGSMWYTGMHNNQRSFAIFNSETGWNPVVLDRLTGILPDSVPPTSQIIDSEFVNWGSNTWKLTNSSHVNKSFVGSTQALSGSHSVKLEVSQVTDCQMYQQTLTHDEVYEYCEGRTLLHLLQGETYKISFMAKSQSGEGQIKVMLKDAKNLDTLFFDSGYQTISESAETYILSYTHSDATAMDVRLEFDLGSQQQVLYLDLVKLIRD